MPCTLNREAYEKLFDEDIEWLSQQPRTLERDHIVDCLKWMRANKDVVDTTSENERRLAEQVFAALDYAHACAEQANNEMHPDKCWGSCQCGRQERLEQIEAAKNALTAQSAEIERLRAALERIATQNTFLSFCGSDETTGLSKYTELKTEPEAAKIAREALAASGETK